MNWNNAQAIPTIAVTDLEEAKRFYGKTLGFEPAKTTLPMEDHMLFRCGNTHVMVYERPEKAGSTATTFALEVQDVEGTVNALRNNGIKFEEYDIPEMGIKTKNGVATQDEYQSAWFKDPWGNIIAIDNGVALTTQTPVGTR